MPILFCVWEIISIKYLENQFLIRRIIMAVKMPELAYPKNALEPFVSRETLEYHYGKHHKGYVDKTNAKIENTDLANADLKEIVLSADKGVLFNLSAQAWNHEFYWLSLRPSAGRSVMSSNLKTEIEKHFGSLEEFKQQFEKEALSHFGSGWAWLERERGGGLKITSTHDADTPLAGGSKPLLTCDVWEHAYYIDYRNDRGKYLKGFWNIVNWEFVSQNYDSK